MSLGIYGIHIIEFDENHLENVYNTNLSGGQHPLNVKNGCEVYVFQYSEVFDPSPRLEKPHLQAASSVFRKNL